MAKVKSRNPVIAVRVASDLYEKITADASANIRTIGQQMEMMLRRAMDMEQNPRTRPCPCECCYQSEPAEPWFE